MTAQYRKVMVVMALFIAIAGWGSYSYANGYNEDFTLRFPAALSRFSSYADVAAVGGASAGSKWQTSVNPAATAWQHLEGAYRVSLNPQYSAIMFQEGTVLNVMSESVTKEFDKLGTIQFSLAQIRSNEHDTLQESSGSKIKFSEKMDFAQIQWGKRFSDDFALGANFNYSYAEITNKIDVLKLADSSSNSYGFRVGSLYRIAPKLLGGLVLDYSWSPSTTTTYYETFSPGSGCTLVNDTTKQFTVRVGPSYEYRKDSTISLDYQYGSFRNDTGILEVHRLYAGIDHRIVDALFVRAGFTADNRGNTSGTCGLGIYPFKSLSIDLGYQYDMFPEIQSEFGRSNLLTVSLSWVL
jgi:hypothetical protein